MLLIVVTLVCAYLACWGPTKERGQLDVGMYTNTVDPPELSAGQMSVVIPFLVGIDEWRRPTDRHRRYYLWFFGYVVKLPCQREIPPLHHVPLLKTLPSIPPRRTPWDPPHPCRKSTPLPRLIIDEDKEERLTIELTP